MWQRRDLDKFPALCVPTDIAGATLERADSIALVVQLRELEERWAEDTKDEVNFGFMGFCKIYQFLSKIRLLLSYLE
jgi:hypothetical protein